MWPENWLPVEVFMGMGTQWCVGLQGLIGLRYEALPVVMHTVGVPAEQQPAVHEAVMDMEQEFLRLVRAARR